MSVFLLKFPSQRYHHFYSRHQNIYFRKMEKENMKADKKVNVALDFIELNANLKTKTLVRKISKFDIAIMERTFLKY